MTNAGGTWVHVGLGWMESALSSVKQSKALRRLLLQRGFPGRWHRALPEAGEGSSGRTKGEKRREVPTFRSLRRPPPRRRGSREPPPPRLGAQWAHFAKFGSKCKKKHQAFFDRLTLEGLPHLGMVTATGVAGTIAALRPAQCAPKRVWMLSDRWGPFGRLPTLYEHWA